jgi:hypothetical protein
MIEAFTNESEWKDGSNFTLSCKFITRIYNIMLAVFVFKFSSEQAVNNPVLFLAIEHGSCSQP